MVEEEFLRLLVDGELRHLLHEGPVAVQDGNQRLPGPGPLQVLSIAAGPLPGVVQIEHRLHVPLTEFDEKTVQTC